MFAIQLDILLFLIFCHVSYCQRRVQQGVNLTSHKPYVVYLVKATFSTRNYDFWLCGGALVTKDFIITSAACVEDVKYLYAIAGYDKYVTDEDIEKDECTKNMKKKVVFTCVPVSYEFDFDLLEKWSHIDIALAKVESPYDFNDSAYEKHCSYKPAIIPINYDPKYQVADTDSMVLGWGHTERWRKHGDMKNYNSVSLQYASTMIMDKIECMKEYEVYPRMTDIIQHYMICTLEGGSIDDKGNPIDKNAPKVDGCSPRRQGVLDNCEEEYGGNQYQYMNTRREVQRTNRTYYNYTTYEFIKKVAREKNFGPTRRNGICQNDHGGPLVTWVGRREVLIGIASVFKITDDNQCIGPYLYTSTMCNGAFLNCVLNSPALAGKKKTMRMDLCDSPPSVKGFDMIQNHISWKDHPAGPAENEINAARISPNENAAPQESYAPNENVEAIPQYVPNEDMASQQYKANENIAKDQQNAANKQFARIGKHPENEGYPKNYSPPIERYQGSKKFPRIVASNTAPFSIRPQRSLYKTI